MAAVESRGNSPRERPESIDDNMAEMMFYKRGCCCWIPCLGGSDRLNKSDGSPWWEKIRTTDQNEERWWNKGFNAVLKVREWSEIMAGPKWKTFIRRFNKKNGGVSAGGGGGGGNGGGSLLSGGKHKKFQYDPLSYSLNFDEGPGHNGQTDEDYVFRDFSSRYATIPISAKSSMDLGKDGPTFTCAE